MTTKSGTKGGEATNRTNDATEGCAAGDPAQQIFTAHQVHTLAQLVYRHLTSAPVAGPTDPRYFGVVPPRTLFYWYP